MWVRPMSRRPGRIRLRAAFGRPVPDGTAVDIVVRPSNVGALMTGRQRPAPTAVPEHARAPVVKRARVYGKEEPVNPMVSPTAPMIKATVPNVFNANGSTGVG